MNNYKSNYEIKMDLTDAINEAINFEFDNGDFNGKDGLYEVGLDAAYAQIENIIIYTTDCQDIANTLDFDIFSDGNDHGVRPNSIEENTLINYEIIFSTEIEVFKHL